MKTVIARYKSAKSNNHEWTQVEFNLPEYDLVWNCDYSITQNQFRILVENPRDFSHEMNRLRTRDGFAISIVRHSLFGEINI